MSDVSYVWWRCVQHFITAILYQVRKGSAEERSKEREGVQPVRSLEHRVELRDTLLDFTAPHFAVRWLSPCSVGCPQCFQPECGTEQLALVGAPASRAR